MKFADDGHGSRKRIGIAAARHATSKLVQSEDLFHIQTLFRGEALASIGSVSHMTITSRVAATEGARLKVDGGIAGKVEKVGAPVGTTLRVRRFLSLGGGGGKSFTTRLRV
ncbi:MAG: hypothetical protein IPO36_01935 [Anaerolineales bacterium]|nr:hypothetical protein [Anaerolineales bacterium]